MFHRSSIAVLIASLGLAGCGSSSGGDAVTPTPPAGNKPPIVEAGPKDNIGSENEYTLNGVAEDPEKKALTYSWAQVSGPRVIVINADSANAKFNAPSVDKDTDLVFRLTVTDDKGAQASDDVTITIKPIPNPPMAKAGPDQTVVAGETVHLRGEFDLNTSLRWTQVGGTPKVNLLREVTHFPEFVAPEVDTPTQLTFRFKVTRTNNTDSYGSDDVTITVNPKPSIAIDLGADLTANEGEKVTLSPKIVLHYGAKVKETDWTQLNGETLNIDTPINSNLTFTAPLDAAAFPYVEYRLTLVEEHTNKTYSDTVRINFKDSASTIAEINFADPGMEKCVKDAAKDKKWTHPSQVTHLNCWREADLVSTRDLFHFDNLTKFEARGAGITDFDAGASKHLRELRLATDKLASIDFSKMPRLEFLYLEDMDSMATLDLSALQRLEILHIYGMPIGAINLDDNALLEEIYLQSTKVSTLSTEKLAHLKLLSLKKNPDFKQLDLRAHIKLRTILVEDSQMATIDLSEQRNLWSLSLANTPTLGNIDLSANTKLTSLDLTNTAATAIALDKNTQLKELKVKGNPALAQLDLSKHSELVKLVADGTKLGDIDLSANTKLQTIDLSGLGITTFDPSRFPNLGWLDLSENDIATLDVSKNGQIQSLYLANNKIAELDLSHVKDLITIDIRNNNTQTLNWHPTSTQEVLRTVRIDNNNALLPLPIDKISRATTLTLSNTQQGDLDLTALTRLRLLDISNTQVANLTFHDNLRGDNACFWVHGAPINETTRTHLNTLNGDPQSTVHFTKPATSFDESCHYYRYYNHD
ncbi:leucine-rich repeat domain-containing protein [Thaumasiovibrio subtropicus]|uniref:leucine-rich repeat domain-containing protein n=1 Tax=Thaumasiovibrio subtropicus TaxID=1891207 RepID=UPI000B34B965|nr:hypothetical protein [Thaumasiovibrio subtropicus]